MRGIVQINFFSAFHSFYFSKNVREGLVNGLNKASHDISVEAIVIIGKDATFPSGADIREFGKPQRGVYCI